MFDVKESKTKEKGIKVGREGGVCACVSALGDGPGGREGLVQNEVLHIKRRPTSR